jgi:hypothetical protein
MREELTGKELREELDQLIRSVITEGSINKERAISNTVWRREEFLAVTKGHVLLELKNLREQIAKETEANCKKHWDEANAKLARVRELCYREGYTTWDDSMVFALNGFGAHNPEELKKWEAMHGHDIRLKCYAEFGCQLLVDPEDIIRALDEESE